MERTCCARPALCAWERWGRRIASSAAGAGWCPGQPDCGECHGRSLGVRRARSALLYNEAARELLAEFKYRRRLVAGEAIFSATKDWVCSGLQSMYNLEDIAVDYIVPVPLHGKRMRERRFNQALFFATRIGRAVSRPVLPAALVRQRPTPTQVGLSANQRMLNVRGAFTVTPRLQPGWPARASWWLTT